MKEHGEGILFLFAIALLLFSSACSTPPPAPSRTAQEVIRLKQEPPTPGVDLFLVIDESGSMVGEKGTDPQGLRYEASKYLLQNLLVKKADRRFPHRISLIHFGDRAIAQPLTDLIPANAADLAQRVPHTGGGLGDTSFIEALRKVREVDTGMDTGMSPDRNRRKKVAVLFTDGEPDDRRKLRQEQYFQEIGDFIRRRLQGFQLYVIGIDRAPERTHWGRSQEAWQKAIGPQNVLFIAEMRELYARYNEVVRQIFELPEVSPDLVTPEERAFEVQPYLEELELHIFPESRELELGIRGPDGTPLKVDGRRVLLTHGPGYDILKVLEPRPGPWRYRVAKGGGRILVLRNPIPFKL